MPQYEQNLAKMLQIWNTTDPAHIRSMVSEIMEHNVHFVDPNHNIIGQEAFIDMVAQVQARIPGASYARASAIEMQNNFCRYHWKIDLNGQRLIDGFDVTEVNDSGKIVKVIGFFGRLERDS